MVTKSCRYWKKCPRFYFWDSLQQNYNGNHFKIKYQKVGLLHTKEGKIIFVRTQMAICYLGVVQVKNVYVDPIQMTFAHCAHVLDMLHFFGT